MGEASRSRDRNRAAGRQNRADAGWEIGMHVRQGHHFKRADCASLYLIVITDGPKWVDPLQHGGMFVELILADQHRAFRQVFHELRGQMRLMIGESRRSIRAT